MAKSPAIFQLSRSLQSYLQPYADMGTATLPPVFQATGGMDFAGLNSAMANAQSLASEPLWKLLNFPSEDAWIAAGRPTGAPPKPAFSSSAQAAPATGSAVAPESAPAKVNVPSQGAGTQFTQGMTTLPPGSTLPSTAMSSGAPQGNFSGQLSTGNIDLDHRPVAPNGNAVSTVRSITIEEDGKQILIPTVAPDGTLLSNQQAIDLYHKTGQNLGTFDTQQNAEAYANALHNAQAARYSTLPNTGLANATAGVAGPGQIVQNGGESLLQKFGDLVMLHKPTPQEQTQLRSNIVPQTPQVVHDVANKASTIPYIGPELGAGVEAVGNPVNLGLMGAGAPLDLGIKTAATALGKNAAENFLIGASGSAAQRGAEAIGANPTESTIAGLAGGFAPSLARTGVKGLINSVKQDVPEDLSQQLKDATVSTVAKTINEAKNPEDVVNTIRQLDYAQRMALTLEVGQNDKTKMLELSKLLNAAEAGDIKAASQLQSGYFRDTAVVKNRASALSKAMDALGAKGPVSSAVEDTGTGGFTPSNPIERALGRSLSQSEQEYINGLPPDRLKQLMTEASAQLAASGPDALQSTAKQLGLTLKTDANGNITPGSRRALSTALDQIERYGQLPQGMTADDIAAARDALGNAPKASVRVSGSTAPAQPAASTSTLPDNGPVAPSEAATASPAPAAASAAPETPLPVTRAPEGATTAPNVTEQALADKAAAAGGAPPKPPVTDLPLGPSGGGSLPRNLKGIGAGDEFNNIVYKFQNDTNAELSQLPHDVNAARSVTSKITGDLQNPQLAAVVRNESQLRDALANYQDKALGLTERVNEIRKNSLGLTPEALKSYAVETQTMIEQARQQVDDAVKAFREDQVGRQFSGAAQSQAMGTLAANDAKQAYNTFDKAQNVLKEAVFGFDLGTSLQHDLTAVRRGGTSIMSGLIGNTVSKFRQALGADPESLGVYFDKNVSPQVQRASDGFIEAGARGAGLNRNLMPVAEEMGTARQVATKAGGALQAFNNVQYKIVSKLGQLAYEGQLYQAKMLGMDITDPMVRKQAAEFGNLVRSSSPTATDFGRAVTERRLLLSPQMTRAQINELTQVFRSGQSPMQALNSANLIASTAATFGMAYLFNKAMGATSMSLSQFLNTAANPLSPTFGKMTLKAKDDSGKNLVWSFLPQYSLESAVLKSVRALSGDTGGKSTLAAIGDAAAKYGVGRLNVLPRDVANAAGVGYGFNSGFHYGDMSLKERGENLVPAPLSVTSAVQQNTTPIKSPEGFGLNILGGNAYSESQSSQQDRLAQEKYGAKWIDLPPNYQASLNKEAAGQGVTLDTKTRAYPYDHASTGAWQYVQKQVAANPQVQQQLSQALSSSGMGNFDITKYNLISEAHKAYVSEAQKAGATLLQAEKSWTNFKSVLNLDTITQQMQKAAVMTDPQIATAVMDEYNSGASTYAPPKWLQDAADQVRQAVASGQLK